VKSKGRLAVVEMLCTPGISPHHHGRYHPGIEVEPRGGLLLFSREERLVAAIAEQRHTRESALLNELLVTGNVAEGFDRLARAFFRMLEDPEEKERRKVTIQIWAESLRDKRIRKIVERGIGQRDLLTAALRRAQQAGQLPEDLDADAFSRVLLGVHPPTGLGTRP
jgi:BetI-type transcriptional repressor, C-terminal